MKLVMSSVVAALLFGCATTPAPKAEVAAKKPTPYQVALARAQADEKDPLVCEERAETGTRFPRQVCRRRSAIDAERDRTQNALDTKHPINVRK